MQTTLYILRGQGNKTIETGNAALEKISNKISEGAKINDKASVNTTTDSAIPANIQQARMSKAVADSLLLNVKKSVSLTQLSQSINPKGSKGTRKSIFSKPINHTTLGKEQFHDYAEILRRQADYKKAYDESVKKWGSVVTSAFFAIRDIGYGSRVIAKEMEKEDNIDSRMTEARNSNPIIAMAYQLAMQEIFDTVVNVVSGNNKLFYLVKLNALALPDNPGIALNEFIEKINTQFFSKEGDLILNNNLSKIAPLIKYYLQCTEETIEGYINKLTTIFQKTNIREFADYIEDARTEGPGLVKVMTLSVFSKK